LQQCEALDAEAKRAEEEALAEAGRTRSDVVDGDEGRWEEVSVMWERGTDGLVGLKGGLTETVARMERVEAVVRYLEGGR